MRILTAIPVYNEERHLEKVLSKVRRYSPETIVVNDGSTDRTAELLASQRDIKVITHQLNKGYGAALISAFRHAADVGADILVTMDCDGQHEPARIPVLLEAIHNVDIVSGSRYLRAFRKNDVAPEDRQRINQIVTAELNEALSLNLTDAFCGFKAYRVAAFSRLNITETGWGMPLQLWVQAAWAGLRIKEIGVPRVYLDANRAFGGTLDNADERLTYYRRVIAAAIMEARSAACAKATHRLCSLAAQPGPCT
jgi:glycosyltransferase involved in cell wall biosynthesis